MAGVSGTMATSVRGCSEGEGVNIRRIERMGRFGAYPSLKQNT